MDDPAKRAAFIAATSCGMGVADAAKLIEVSEDSVTRYRKKNAEFDREYETARLAAKYWAVKCVTKAAEKNANVALAFLGRRYPNEWAHRKPDAIEPQKIAALINQFIAHVMAVIPDEFHGKIAQSANGLLIGVMANQNDREDEGESDG